MRCRASSFSEDYSFLIDTCPRLEVDSSRRQLQTTREALEPITHPPNVGSWFNAYDERDLVSLNPLDEKNFPVSPKIQNYGGVKNESDNHHKIGGYLSDPVIATAISEALTA